MRRVGVLIKLAMDKFIKIKKNELKNMSVL